MNVWPFFNIMNETVKLSLSYICNSCLCRVDGIVLSTRLAVVKKSGIQQGSHFNNEDKVKYPAEYKLG